MAGPIITPTWSSKINGDFYIYNQEVSTNPITLFTTDERQYYFHKKTNTNQEYVGIELYPLFSQTNQVFNFGKLYDKTALEPIPSNNIKIQYPGRYRIQGYEISIYDDNNIYRTHTFTEKNIDVIIDNNTELNVYDVNNQNLNFIMNESVYDDGSFNIRVNVTHWYQYENGVKQPFIGGVSYRLTIQGLNSPLLTSTIDLVEKTDILNFDFSLYESSSQQYSVKLYSIFRNEIKEVNLANPFIYVNQQAKPKEYNDIVVSVSPNNVTNNKDYTYTIGVNLSDGTTQLNLINQSNSTSNSYYCVSTYKKESSSSSQEIATKTKINDNGNYNYIIFYTPIYPTWKPNRYIANNYLYVHS